MAGLLRNIAGLIYRVAGAVAGRGLVRSPCPDCCDVGTAVWFRACSCFKWDVVEPGACGESFTLFPPPPKCVYISGDAFLSDDSTRTLWERSYPYDPGSVGGDRIVVRSGSLCYEIDRQAVPTLPAGAMVIAGPGDTADRRASCDDGCGIDSTPGLRYIKLSRCSPSAPVGNFYTCRNMLYGFSGTVVVNGSCYQWGEGSEMAATLPEGATYATPTKISDTCCDCQSGREWFRRFDGSWYLDPGKNRCEDGELQQGEYGCLTGTLPNGVRCCCGRCGPKSVFVTASSTSSWTGGPFENQTATSSITSFSATLVGITGNPDPLGTTLCATWTVLYDVPWQGQGSGSYQDSECFALPPCGAQVNPGVGWFSPVAAGPCFNRYPAATNTSYKCGEFNWVSDTSGDDGVGPWSCYRTMSIVVTYPPC